MNERDELEYYEYMELEQRAGTDMDTLVAQKDPVPSSQQIQDDIMSGLGDGLSKVAKVVGDLFDRFGGAPTREAVKAWAETEQPENLKEFFSPSTMPKIQALKAGGKQLAKGFIRKNATKDAVSPHEISKMMKLSDISIGEAYGKLGNDPSELPSTIRDMSPADAGAFLAGVGLDWTNFIPATAAIKIPFKALKTTGKLSAPVVAKTADLITDTRGASTALESIQKAGQTAKEGLETTFSAKVLPEHENYRTIAEKIGLNPNLIEEGGDLTRASKYGEESSLSIAERVAGEGPTGQKFRESYERTLDKIRDYSDEQISLIAKPLEAPDAGNYLLKSVDDGIDRVFKRMDLTHKDIIEGQPGLQVNEKAWDEMLSKFKGVENESRSWMKRGIKSKRVQGEQLQDDIAYILEGNGSYKQAYEALRQIGETAFKNEKVLADIPPNVKAYRKLYFALDDALSKTVKKEISPKAYKDLKAHNKFMSDFFGDKKQLDMIIGKDTKSGEAVFRSGMGNTKNIAALKKIIKPEELNALKASWLKSKVIYDQKGNYSLGQLFKTIESPANRSVKNALFETSELKALQDAKKLWLAQGDKVSSYSGTGRSQAYLGSLKDILNRSSEDLITTPIKKAADLPKKKLGFLPMVTTPKEYVKNPQSWAKVAQVFSAYTASKERDRDEVLGNLFGEEILNLNVGKRKKLYNNFKEQKITKNVAKKNLLQREINKILKGEK